VGKNRKSRILKSNTVTNNGIKSIDDVVSLEQRLAIEKQLVIQKAYQSGDVNQILKADNYLKSIQPKQDDGAKSIMVDPLDVASSFGYKDKPFQLSYDMLRAMAKTHIPHAIIKTRKSQATGFCEPVADRYSTGFTIEKRNRWRSTQKDEKLSAQEQKRADAITDFILNCGNGSDFDADTFETWIEKIIADSLELDQATTEIRKDRLGRPVSFFATDAATYRKAVFSEDEQVELKNGKPPSYVQLYQSKIHNYFYADELMFGIRNPSTDIRTYGYGKAELEDMIELITNLLNADQYNGNFFKVGSSPQGILTYSGNINQNTLNQFRSEWQQMVVGVANSHRIPIINGDKINFIPTHVPNKDMEFSKFQEFLIKVATAIYTIDPSEIGFPMDGAADGGNGLGGRNNSEKLKFSKDKGLKPLLKKIQHWINKWIVWQLDPAFEFRFVGIDDAEDKETELDQDIKKVSNFMTVNEIRQKHNLDPIDGMDIILNPVASQATMMAQQGDEESNQAVDNMQDEPNPFMKSLQSDLERLLS
jgi:hypothetical protein